MNIKDFDEIMGSHGGWLTSTKDRENVELDKVNRIKYDSAEYEYFIGLSKNPEEHWLLRNKRRNGCIYDLKM